MHRAGFDCALFLACIAVVTCQTNREKIRSGLGTVYDDTFGGSVTVQGTVPTEITGYFIRQSCGTFGDTHLTNEENMITHLFDCIPMGTAFRFESGVPTFYQRYWNTTTVEIWKGYGMNMSLSKVYFSTVYSSFSTERYNQWLPFYGNSSKIGEMPHVTWWNMNNQPISMSEGIGGVLIDLESFSHRGPYPWEDDNLGIPGSPIFYGAPAHEAVDADGVIWHSTNVVTLSAPPVGFNKHIVYKVVGNTRAVVGEFKLPDFNLTRCSGSRYPDHQAMYGYLHSFSVTENYVILPVTSFLLDPCQTLVYRTLVPLYRDGYNWVEERPGRLLVMQKSTGTFVADIEMESFFVTHQANAYEENGKIYLDMLMYNDSHVYDRSLYVNNMLNEDGWNASLTRLVVDTSAWTLDERRHLRTPQFDHIEFTTINSAYNARKYSYVYFIKNAYRTGGEVVKMNIDDGNEITYTASSDFFPHEPIFVPGSPSNAEDDGFLMVQGYDSGIKKGKMVILDARTMEELAVLTAPDMALFGIHNRFFPRNPAVSKAASAERAAILLTSLSSVFLMIKHFI